MPWWIALKMLANAQKNRVFLFYSAGTLTKLTCYRISVRAKKLATVSAVGLS